MTVRELIKELKKMPLDYQVTICDHDNDPNVNESNVPFASVDIFPCDDVEEGQIVVLHG